MESLAKVTSGRVSHCPGYLNFIMVLTTNSSFHLPIKICCVTYIVQHRGRLSIVIHTCNLSTWEAQAGASKFQIRSYRLPGSTTLL
jgi:hypothetical protein